jgi:rubrerythrin
MPNFTSPFESVVPRKLSHEELVRAIRLDLAAEEEAVYLYTAHAEAVDDPQVKKVLLDIADEERVHVGEFTRVLEILTGDENQFIQQGIDEVNRSLGMGPAKEEPTVGSLTS